jgi:ABC-type transporter Mla maintaining outer membrane lipid asymmetry permease subunit MlaE
VGGQGVVLIQAAQATLRGELEVSELQKSLIRLGVHSIPVIFFTALFVGGIMVVQSAPLLTRFGAESLLGWGAGFGILLCHGHVEGPFAHYVGAERRND